MSKKSSVIEWVDINLLDVSENLRGEIDTATLQPLLESIRSVGILEPLLVRKTATSRLVENGSRRLLAAKLAGLTEVPVHYVNVDEEDTHAIQRQLIANCQHEALPATAVARGVFDLMDDLKCSAREAAARIGMSSRVGKLTRMMRLPTAILEQIDTGLIPASCGYYLSRVSDPAKQAELASQIVKGQLTRDQLERIVQSMHPTKSATAKRRKVAFTLSNAHMVTLEAANLSLASLIESLELLLKRAKQERKRKIELSTFVTMMQDQQLEVAPTPS